TLTKCLACSRARSAARFGAYSSFSESFVDGRHAPVAQPTARVLAMELPVLRVPGISGERRPDLARYAVVARDRDHLRVDHDVRTQEVDIARGGGAVDGLLVRRPSTALA